MGVCRFIIVKLGRVVCETHELILVNGGKLRHAFPIYAGLTIGGKPLLFGVT